MRFIFKHKLLVSVLITLLYVVALLPVTEALWFTHGALAHKELIYSHILHLAFSILFGIGAWFVLHFIEQLWKQNPLYKTWLRITLIYGLIMGALLATIWPGYWRWDELDVLYASQSYTIFSWQHIFTQFQYIFSLYLIPSSVGIPIIQLLIISIIVGYIGARLKDILLNRWLRWVVLAPLFISPVILLSNFNTLRSQLIGYLLLLVLFKLYLYLQDKRPAQHPFTTFISFSAVISLIAVWRSENIIYLILIPLLWWALRLDRIFQSQPYKSIAAIALSAMIFLSFYGVVKITEDPMYKVTASLNTLSVMLHDDLNKSNLKEQLNDIDSAINLSVLRQYPDPCNIPSINNGLLRPNYEDGYPQYLRGMIGLYWDNLGLFVKHQLSLYLDTNHSDATITCHNIWAGQFVQGIKLGDNIGTHPYAEWFINKDRASVPINTDLRSWVLRKLILLDYPIMRSFIWSVSPVLLLMFLVLIHAIIKRKLLWILVALLLLGHSLIIFLTAPSALFMYYFPVYLVGLVLGLLYFTVEISKKVKAKR